MKIINFYEKRWIFFAISLAIFLIGIFYISNVQLDINFKGGAIMNYSFSGDISADKAADIASDKTGCIVSGQITSDLATGSKRLVLNIAGDEGLDAKVKAELDEALRQEFPGAELEDAGSRMVAPYFGRRFLRDGIIAILLSSFFVVVYVWIRFRRIGGLSAGLMALVALFHDLLVVFFTCVIFGIPIGDSFIAVALTIIGYSINDTIVIYDRIRENFKKYARQPVEFVTNLSITQSMTRSINTNLAVMLSVSLIYILAFANSIESIQSFALPMAIGSLSGCYSTICISGPLWVMWKKHKAKKH